MSDAKKHFLKHFMLLVVVFLGLAVLVANFYLIYSRNLPFQGRFGIVFTFVAAFIITLLPAWISLVGQRINFFAGRLDSGTELGQKINAFAAIGVSYFCAIIFFVLWVIELQKTLVVLSRAL